MKANTVEGIIKACTCLHNYLMQTENAGYVPMGFVDAEDETGCIIPGSWRSETLDDNSAIQHIGRTGSNNYKADASPQFHKAARWQTHNQGIQACQSEKKKRCTKSPCYTGCLKYFRFKFE